ncbi:MAG: hypothetical protein ACSLFA_05000 [Mycobacterium sp.]
MTSDVVAHPQAVRGRTVIDDRVRSTLIERAVLSVPGVLTRRTMVPGRSLPAVTVAGDPAARTVDVHIAATWPVDSAAILESVRAAVIRELATSLAETPERVGVTISRVDADRTPAQVADAYELSGDETLTVDDGGIAPAGAQHRRFAPRARAAASTASVVIALVLAALGAVAVRDAFTPADRWTTAVLGWAADAQWQWWVWPAAVLAALLGLALLVAAVKPRRRTYIAVGSQVWVPRKNSQQWTATEADTSRSPEGDVR